MIRNYRNPVIVRALHRQGYSERLIAEVANVPIESVRALVYGSGSRSGHHWSRVARESAPSYIQVIA